jgi:ribosomal protein L22
MRGDMMMMIMIMMKIRILIIININLQVNKMDFTIKEIYVSQGPVMKRFRPRAQGRAFVIRKPLCHITAIVEFRK